MGDTIGQNKNGNGSYDFSEANYNAGKCGKGHYLTSDIPQGYDIYDAARANMGSPWRMPTKAQCQELIDNTTSTWTTINGVNGRKFSSKKDSTKYIFLPAGGWWVETAHYNKKQYCYSWTTSLSSSTQSYLLYFISTGSLTTGVSYRYWGFSVRAK